MNKAEIAEELGVSESQIGRCPTCGIWMTKAEEEPEELLCKQCENEARKKKD